MSFENSDKVFVSTGFEGEKRTSFNHLHPDLKGITKGHKCQTNRKKHCLHNIKISEITITLLLTISNANEDEDKYLITNAYIM